MKGIKFRAWTGDGYYYQPYNDYHGVCVFWQCCEENEYHEVEQFTGLRDVLGKEIYEGDILELNRGFGPAQGRRGDRGFVVADPVELGYLIQSTWTLGRLTAPRSFHLQVIGNIHEHEDLLKGG